MSLILFSPLWPCRLTWWGQWQSGWYGDGVVGWRGQANWPSCLARLLLNAVSFIAAALEQKMPVDMSTSTNYRHLLSVDGQTLSEANFNWRWRGQQVTSSFLSIAPVGLVGIQASVW